MDKPSDKSSKKPGSGQKNTKTGKKKSYKPIIAIIVIILIVGSLVLYSYLTNRVVPSAPGTVGNTAGNLYNGGLFCEKDGRIYFSNPNDDNTLYSMSSSLGDFKKLYDDYCRYINADENYVYYTRMNNKKENPTQSVFIFYSTGVFRITKSGKNLKMISSDPSGGLLLYDNKLYYQIYKNNALSLFRSGIDGSDEKKIISDDTPVVSAYDGYIYYSGKLSDQNIHMISPSGIDSVAFETKAYLPIATEEGIFYVSTSDRYKIYLSDFEGKNAKCLVEKPVSWYNITSDGRFLFYQCDEKDESAIYCLDRTNGTTDKIADGNYKWINIAGGYCFFYDFFTDKAYAYDYNAKELNFFNPPSKK